MPQFFINTISEDGTCTIEGDDYYHLVKVRRVKKGDFVSLRDSEGSPYEGHIADITETKILVDSIRIRDNNKNNIDVTLCISILKGKKFDLVLQKAVEVGVRRIVPVVSERTIPVIGDSEEKKIDRWRKIASEASKQSMREFPPVVEAPVSFHETVSLFRDSHRIIAHTDVNCMDLKVCLRNAEKEKSVAVLVGPEGGFSDKEVREAVNEGWHACNFGFTAMRSETAAIVLPALIIYEWSGIDENNGKQQRDGFL